MNNDYEYVGVPLTPSIAQKLIKEQFSGQTVKKQKIVETVVQIHEERGGLPSEAQDVGLTILTALRTLQRDGCAEHIVKSYWRIGDFNYEYVGVPLTPKIAQELIKGQFSGHTVEEQEIVETVVQIHEERGGLPSESQDVGLTIQTALRTLQRNGDASRISQNRWQISERNIGSGEGSVYLYYFPSDREATESRGESVWPCKIGSTEGDPYRRVRLQTSGTLEEPRIGLIIRIGTSSDVGIHAILEKAIHAILTVRGRHMEHVQGTEWFVTNPSEVEEIHAFIMAIMNLIG